MVELKNKFLGCHGWAVMNKAQCAHEVAYLEKLWNEVRRTKAAGKDAGRSASNSGAYGEFFEIRGSG
jgi:hypothetical protein